MKAFISSAATAAALMTMLAVNGACARFIQQPSATGIMAFPMDGYSPRPTAAPGVHRLLRRQFDDDDDEAIADETVLVAPDNTCGFISGRFGAAYTCYSTNTCLLLTASSTFSGVMACCDEETCAFRADCVDYDSYYGSSACDDGCALDIYTLKW